MRTCECVYACAHIRVECLSVNTHPRVRVYIRLFCSLAPIISRYSSSPRRNFCRLFRPISLFAEPDFSYAAEHARLKNFPPPLLSFPFIPAITSQICPCTTKTMLILICHVNNVTIRFARGFTLSVSTGGHGSCVYKLYNSNLNSENGQG